MSTPHHHASRPGPAFNEASLTLYFRALCGRACDILPYADDADLWQHPDTASTMRLPSHPSGGASFYQVAVTHRALHHSLGTFAFDLDRSEPLFPRLRPSLAPQPGVPALERFVRLFGRTALAVEVFAVLEDLRIDAAAARLYRGLAADYASVRRAALTERPDLSTLAPRSAVAEALVQVSLGATTLRAPEALRGPLSRLAAIALRVAGPAATVESAAEATIRAYAVLAVLPNIGAHRTVRAMSVAELAAAAAPATAWGDDVPETPFGPELRLEGDEMFDIRLVPVRYRDVPGPRYLGAQASSMPLQEAILRMMPDGGAPAEAGDADADGFTQKSLAAERGDVDVAAPQRPDVPPEPLPHDHGPDLDGHHEHVHGRMRATGPDEYVYPEWDSVAGRYLPDWCLLHVRTPKPKRSERARRRALTRYGHLLPGIVAALERVRPAGRDLVTRQPYGDDLDLDACIDALVDLRSGAHPSERVYASMIERRRDVAAAFAIDLSSSTAERLAAGAERGREVRRILDLQRDAVTLLSEALDAVGDVYGIYGFSGGGRADVRLSVVKDLDERRSPAVRHRMEGLTPDHMTRMGPPIRHLTARLARADAATKVLFIVSDGRPYDVDYGQQYGDEAVLDYAVADTARAMVEARAQGVRPYLITVDPAGGDYLGKMCDPREYHVIDDAHDLPRALAELYVVARAGSIFASTSQRSEQPSPSSM